MTFDSDFPVRLLGEVSENHDSGRIPVKASERKRGPFPYYGAQGIVDYVDGYLFDGEFVLIAEDGENLRSRRENIALIARGRFWVNNHAHILRGNQLSDTRFLCYAINQSDISGYITGSTIPKLSQRSMNSIPIPLPPLVEQRAISALLGALDGKIDLNRQMNETLEAMARAIFKDWFVDFGPVRAKAEGCPPYLSSDLWSLFPDKLDDDDKPVGWRRGRLEDVASPAGQSVKPDELSPDTPYIGLEHMPRRSISLDSWEGAGKVTSGKLAFRRGDFLFGKLRPYFHKVGIAPIDGICSTDIVVLKAKKPIASAFVLSCISLDEFVAYTDRSSAGTKMPRTSWALMARYELTLPPDELMKAFHDAISPLFEHIVGNIHESRTLVALRDLLLPKLMSGEIRLKDAEQALEAVA